MGAPRLSSAFQIGIGLLNSVVDAVTGTILVQTGDAANDVGGSSNVVWWQHVGFRSRHPNPNAGQSSSEGFIVRGGQNSACIASRDIRGQALSADIGPGETCVYAAGADGYSQGCTLWTNDGSIITKTKTGNTSTGQPVAWKVTPAGLSFSAPWGTMTFDATGFSVSTTAGGTLTLNAAGQAALSGVQVLLGEAPTIPVVIGPSGLSGIGSATVLSSP